MPSQNDPIGNGIRYPFQIQNGGVAFSGAPKGSDMTDTYRNRVVQQSIMQILLTAHREWIMRRVFGSGTQSIPFNGINQAAALVEQRVIRAVIQFEKRISNLRTRTAIVAEEGLVEVELTYTIIRTGNVATMVYPWYLEEAA